VKKAILLLIFYSALAPVWAQLLPFQRYTTKDGLVADRVTAIAQDEKGVMWFGSFFGLGNYDGISFRKVHLPFEQQNKFVTAVLPMGNKVYAGFIFGGGLAELNGGTVKRFSLTQFDSKTSNDITAIGKFDDKSIMVANGENEIYKFSEGKFTYLYSFGQDLGHSSVHVLYKDQSKNIWVGTERGLFVIPSSGKKKRVRFFPQSDILSLLPTANKKIWIAVNK